ncbi:MAG: RNA polymerase sigma factor [Acidobacteriota bacterium]|nr:RNA polymerase sigma factor [Acidobacteriota bacterium]
MKTELIAGGIAVSAAPSGTANPEFGFPSFWDRLAPLKSNLYSYILKALNFSQDADDVFQETVLCGYRYFRSFRRDGEFGAWIFGIAHNQIRSQWKRDNRRQAMADAATAAVVSPESENELVREIYRFASGLAPRERSVFFLFYESGFSIAEIAGIAGLKEGHVKWILFQARASVRKIMGASDEE